MDYKLLVLVKSRLKVSFLVATIAASALIILIDTSQEASALSSLVGKWPFNERSGTIAKDTSSNNHDGTIDGATHLSSKDCKSGHCLGFDGIDDFVSVGSLGINSDGQPFSIVTWINPSESAINDGLPHTIVAEGSTGAGTGDGQY